MLATTAPFPQFFDADGDPLDNGELFYGTANLNPETNPVLVYWDAAGAQPAAQPISVMNGYPVRNGTPANVYVAADYSLTVRDRKGRLVYYSPNSAAYANDLALQAQLTALIGNLANTSDTGLGDAMIGVMRDDIAGAVGLTLHDWNKRERVNVRQIGVTGDGSTDDAALLNTLGALGIPLFIPYTATGYKIGSTVTFSCDVYCEGFFTPTAAIGAAVNDYNRFAIVIPSAGYPIKRRIVGLKVVGSVALRAANVSGIRNDCENSYCTNLHVSQLNYGIVARSYSQTYLKCNANQCNTNFDAYARSAITEVNALTIIGGNYDSPVNRSLYIGDTSWSDSWGAGNYHGSVIKITGGANFDGGEAKIDWCLGVSFDTIYIETSATNYGIVLGSADGSVRNVDIQNCFFKTLRIATKCLAAVDGLRVGRCTYTSVSHCALYVISDLYPYEYVKGDPTASFTLGREVHTGFRFLAPSAINFVNVTLPHLGLYRGAQSTVQDVGEWYPSGVMKNAAALLTESELSGETLRRYTTPFTGVAGTVANTGIFTCTTPADSAKFNGGDRATLSVGGATYVRFVDYEAGIVYLDGNTTTGAATASQVIKSTRRDAFGSAAPVTGSWQRGDRVQNYLPAVGSPKAWSCTVTGTPGTWVSEGNL